MPYGRTEDIVYFTTERGLVAVSLDEGATILLPTGKTMKPTEAWEESPVELPGKLNERQRTAVEAFLACPPMTEVEEIAWRHHQRLRKVEKDYRQASVGPRELSEDVTVVKSDLDD